MTDSTSHTLVLARHAKAEGSAASDHERELSARGRAEAASMGRWLSQAGHRFGVVVCSTAIRARQTWSEIEAIGVHAEEIRFDDRVYNGEPDLVMAVLSEVPDRCTSVLVVGHAPSIPELADRLGGTEGSDQRAVETVRTRFPPGCLAVLSIGDSWSALVPGAATLSEVVNPRGSAE